MYLAKIITRIAYNSYQKNIEQATSFFEKVLTYQNQLYQRATGFFQKISGISKNVIYIL